MKQTNERPVAIVTGGAGPGIGHGLTEALVAEGWSVVLTDRKPERGLALAEHLGSDFVEVVPVDVTEPAAPEQTVRAATARFGRLDGLVNNVGIGLAKPAGEVADDEFLKMFNVDFMASFRFVRAALPELTSRAGAIVNIGSVHARLATAKFALYAATKSAIEAFTRGLAADYGPQGVRANTVHPGLVDSPQNEELIAQFAPDAQAWIQEFTHKRQCIPVLPKPQEVGHIVAFLLGPKARCITGQAIFIDSGTTTLLWNRE